MSGQRLVTGERALAAVLVALAVVMVCFGVVLSEAGLLAVGMAASVTGVLALAASLFVWKESSR